MDLDVLKKIGLSQGEVTVYSALLNIGNAPVSRIHENTGIERRNIYDILNKLIERGLITYIVENKRKFFSISHPKNIISYVEEQKDELDKTKKDVEKELPLMIEKFMLRKPAISAEVFRGKEGIKAVWEDMLNYSEIRWIAAGRYVPKKMPNYFVSWNRRRVKQKTVIFNLLRHELRKEVKPFALEKVKFLPVEFSGNPTVIGIYGNKIVDFIFSESFFAFVIESKEISESYRRYFKYLWEKVAKP